MRATPKLAKLTVPRLHGALLRERLFARLDEARRRPSTCIIGPPGAGKTTLVASWLEVRKCPCLWYQADAGDADIASLFHYFAMAARSLGSARTKLPAFGPEYRQDTSGFSRRFFRALFAQLPASTVLVVDNLHEIAGGSPSCRVLAEAIAEIPDHINLLTISREELPEAFARPIANQLVTTIDWEDLRLTAGETEEIVASRQPSLRSKASGFHEQCQGWAAGLTLILEHEGLSMGLPQSVHSETRESIFRYFTSQILSASSVEERRFLMISAFLPRMTVGMAAALTGDALSGKRLGSLHRRRLFTHRQPGGEPTYVFHALFRNFLLALGTEELSPGECQALWKRCGGILENSGLLDDAAESYARGEAWHDMHSLIERHASELSGQGRTTTLKAWICRMPADYLARYGWLEYWLATSVALEDALLSLPGFERAYGLFVSDRDIHGQIQTLCATIEAIYFATTNHALMDPWIPRLKAAIGATPRIPESSIELRAYGALLLATLYRRPDSRELARIAQRTLELLDSDAPADQRVRAATFLMVYCTFTGHFSMAEVVRIKGDAIVSREGATPYNLTAWTAWKCYLWQILFEPDQGIPASREAERIGETHGFFHHAYLACYYRSGMEAKGGDLAAAEASISKSLVFLDPGRKLQACLSNAASAWLAVYANRPAMAVEHGRLAMAIARELESPSYRIHHGTPLVFGLIETGAIDEARAAIEDQRAAIAGTAIACFEPLLKCAEARIAELKGDSATLKEIVRSMWSEARREDHGRYLAWMIPWIPRFAALALDERMEAEYVAGLVRHYRWKPPEHASDRWPWPIKVYALGKFDIFVDGQLLQFGRKTPKKPLAVLKAIVAQGGRNVPEARLLDLVWPDLEGDAAGRALDITLHRLRSWLRHPEAILQKARHVSLDPQVCWVDAWHFEHEIRSDDGSRAEKVLGLYQGSFLAGDGEAPWIVGYRDRLRARFVGLVSSVARTLESGGALDDAVALYLRGIEVDDLAEPLYQGLMRCYQGLGRVPEALGTYRRLRQILSVTLGVRPGATSEQLYESLRRG